MQSQQSTEQSDIEKRVIPFLFEDDSMRSLFNVSGIGGKPRNDYLRRKEHRRSSKSAKKPSSVVAPRIMDLSEDLTELSVTADQHDAHGEGRGGSAVVYDTTDEQGVRSRTIRLNLLTPSNAASIDAKRKDVSHVQMQQISPRTMRDERHSGNDEPQALVVVSKSSVSPVKSSLTRQDVAKLQKKRKKSSERKDNKSTRHDAIGLRRVYKDYAWENSSFSREVDLTGILSVKESANQKLSPSRRAISSGVLDTSKIVSRSSSRASNHSQSVVPPPMASKVEENGGETDANGDELDGEVMSINTYEGGSLYNQAHNASQGTRSTSSMALRTLSSKSSHSRLKWSNTLRRAQSVMSTPSSKSSQSISFAGYGQMMKKKKNRSERDVSNGSSTVNDRYRSRLLSIQIRLAENLDLLESIVGHSVKKRNEMRHDYIKAYCAALDDIIDIKSPFSGILSQVREALVGDATIASDVEKVNSYYEMQNELAKARKDVNVLSDEQSRLSDKVSNLMLDNKRLRKVLASTNNRAMELQNIIQDMKLDRTKQHELLKKIYAVEREVDIQEGLVVDDRGGMDNQVLEDEEDVTQTTEMGQVELSDDGLGIANHETNNQHELQSDRHRDGDNDIDIDNDEEVESWTDPKTNMTQIMNTFNTHARGSELRRELVAVEMKRRYLERELSLSKLAVGDLEGFNTRSLIQQDISAFEKRLPWPGTERSNGEKQLGETDKMDILESEVSDATDLHDTHYEQDKQSIPALDETPSALTSARSEMDSVGVMTPKGRRTLRNMVENVEAGQHNTSVPRLTTLRDQLLDRLGTEASKHNPPTPIPTSSPTSSTSSTGSTDSSASFFNQPSHSVEFLSSSTNVQLHLPSSSSLLQSKHVPML